MQNFSFLNLNISLFKEGITVDDLPRSNISILDQKKYLNNEIFKFFDLLNLNLFLVEVFYKSPGDTGGIHVDVIIGDFTKLNWVYGGGDSKMNWYKPFDNKHIVLQKTTANTPYISYSRHQVEKIEDTIIKNPTLVQVGVPHDVSNVTEDRFCISFVFRDNITNRRLTMAESLERFKDYISIN